MVCKGMPSDIGFIPSLRLRVDRKREAKYLAAILGVFGILVFVANTRKACHVILPDGGLGIVQAKPLRVSQKVLFANRSKFGVTATAR